MPLTSLSGAEARRPRATMRDVAALAGVSLKTVSRVVNAEPGVSAEVVSRVEKAVSQLGYRHNLAASSLRRGDRRTGTVGALLQDVSNSFSASLLRRLEDEAHERGVAILASSLDETPERERALVESFVRRRVDGLLLMPATDRQDYLADDLQSGLPVVFVDRRPNGVDADSITVDNVLGGSLATRHLVAGGHRRIALLGDLPFIQTARLRRQGYTEALIETGLGVSEELVSEGLRSLEDVTASLDRLLALEEPPTALFAARNTVAINTIRALKARGLAGRIAIVGFDDFPLADIVDPPLTVIRQDVDTIGRQITRRLFARIDGDDSAPHHIVIRPELVLRGSGEIPPQP